MQIASLLISLSALFVSGFALWETRKNNRISMRPIITGQDFLRSNVYFYQITNKGNGPAYFKSVEWFYDAQQLKDKTFAEKVDEIIEAYGLPQTRSITTVSQSEVMRPGESIVLGEIFITHEHKPIIEEIQKKGFGVRIVYESAYGDRDVFVNDERIDREEG